MPSTTLIGDLVGSRAAADRRGLHERLQAAIRHVNDTLAPGSPLRVQVGDEYQGVFTTLGEAIHAALVIRLALLPDADVRHGLGRGAVEVLGEQPHVEDGPGWWSARLAIERVSLAEQQPAERSLRTAYSAVHSRGGTADPAEPAVNAALALRDEIVGSLGLRGVSVLRGLLAERSQKEIADELGVSPSAVSQRVRADGIGALLAAHERLRGMP